MTERIFISSVQKELAAERLALRDFIHGDALLSRFFRVFLFEDLPAQDRRADELYLDEVARADIYLGVFGQTYGFEDNAGVSPTEREFDEATARGKERIIFVKGVDDAGRDAKMKALVHKAGGQLIRRRFIETSELTTAVYASLVAHLERTGRLRTRPFDAAACLDARVEDLSAEKLDLFLARAHNQRGYALGPGTPMAHALAHMNLLDNGQPSHAAMLLFGAQPQRFLISSEVKCMHFHGRTVQKPIPSYQIFKGTVFELVDQGVDFVLSKLNARVGTRAETNQAPVTYELPREAVAEAIVNAVMHRDYASNASVQVMLFADRLEIWNPGELPPGLTMAQLERPHPSIPHNPLLAEPMFLSRYAEKAGSGILDMFALCAADGLPAPTFRQDGGQFVQTLWRPLSAQSAVLNEPQQVTQQVTQQVPQQVEAAPLVARLLRVMPGDRECAREELMSALGLADRNNFVVQYLRPAIDAGLVEATVPDKPTSRLQKYRLTPRGLDWLQGS